MIIKKGDKFIFEETGEVIEPKFQDYKCPEDYIRDGIKWLEPMTAQEVDQDLEEFNQSLDYLAEEKLDGTRALFHFTDKGIRVFSRRVSKKTNWFVENSDLLPHIRDWEFPKEYIGTVIDGELYIPDRPFKDVASTMNCLWDKAIDRQLELGFVHLKAFDILYYKSIKITAMPLYRRKDYLEEVLEVVKCPYIEKIKSFVDTIVVPLTLPVMKELNKNTLKDRYPVLYKEIQENLQGQVAVLDSEVRLSKQAYYEYVVCNGGEGIILKNIKGKYYHRRTKEYLKVKKFLTRDVVIIGYSEPTMLYEGKTLSEGGTWEYWCDAEDEHNIIIHEYSLKEADDLGLIPVTKYYALGYIGTIQFGVVITDKELEEWKKNNPKEKPIVKEINGKKLLYVGETSGMTEEVREEISKNKEKYIGTVIEIKAQEVIKKTGKLRHPRYMRMRFDKSLEDCTWKDHIS